MDTVNLVPIELGFSKTQINCVIFRRDSISSYGDNQVVSYYDSTRRVTFAERKLNENRWSFERLTHRGNVKDAHNCISILHDTNGILHTSYDHHNHPLRYRKTNSAHGMEFTKSLNMTGVNELKVCYPQFFRDSKGFIHFYYRVGKSGNGNLCLKKYDPKANHWFDMHTNLIDGEKERNAYWQIWIDINDIIHLSWNWRQTGGAETNHDVCYAKSLDGGITWLKSDNIPQEIPITYSNADYAIKIPQNSTLINQTSIAVDSKGNPYIATFYRPDGETNPQYMIVYLRDGHWNTAKIWYNSDNFNLEGRGTLRFPLSRPLLLIDKQDNVFVVYRAKSRNEVVSIAKATDLSLNNWDVQDLTDFPVATWEPTMDSTLWKQKNILHLLVQNTGFYRNSRYQKPTMLYILECNPIEIFKKFK